MFHLCFSRVLRVLFLLAAVLALWPANAPALEFEVWVVKGLVSTPQTGRLIVIVSRSGEPEPRLTLGRTGPDAPFLFARDANDLAPGKTSILDQSAIACPIAGLAELPAGDYFIQALLDSNRDLHLPASAPGNLYSKVGKMHLDPAKDRTVKLDLSQQNPPEQLPRDTEFVKFVKIQSRLLSEFYGRPMYLRAGIILPRDYAREPERKYPLWVRVGGYGARYSAVNSLMGAKADFRKTWLADGTPRMILLQLDGAGPYGDPYQINSANNGPYGDAIVQELIPYVEKQFRAIGEPRARVVSGLSTGGWASLALQVFYPDFFNGTWTFCPDPVDFRAFELVNVFDDDNAYVNTYGFERPSERTVTGDVRLTMRREVQIENVIGQGNSWRMSGGQWCAWNAVYGPRGADGHPVPLWDPRSGRIDHKVAEQWKKYDLRLVMEKNWKTLGPKLRGKLHISVGDADSFFLNNAVHLLDEFLTHADPPYEGRIRYGPGKGHGWSDIGLEEQLKEMDAAMSVGRR